MSIQSRNVNLDYLLNLRRSTRIEFWQNNGDGTTTRLSDGLTLTAEEYNDLPGRQRAFAWPGEEHNILEN
ncbi:MAG: hypothetical protein JXJ20_01865 [Anaerolineae bacterium]|nr:hypothetical protein [Anaerolineae bacterium]